jgi:hypothetical protein
MPANTRILADSIELCNKCHHSGKDLLCRLFLDIDKQRKGFTTILVDLKSLLCYAGYFSLFTSLTSWSREVGHAYTRLLAILADSARSAI